MHLAALFVRGIEYASFANDICGNPMEPINFCLSNYFEGSVFQYVYTNLHNGSSMRSVLLVVSIRIENFLLSGFKNSFFLFKDYDPHFIFKLFDKITLGMRERLALSIDPMPYFNLPKNVNQSERLGSKLRSIDPSILNEPVVEAKQNEKQLDLIDLIKQFKEDSKAKKIEKSKVEPSYEDSGVLYFEDSFLAKDYVPYVPFEGFIPNKSDYSQEKVLRFKWTEKLEKVTFLLIGVFFLFKCLCLQQNSKL